MITISPPLEMMERKVTLETLDARMETFGATLEELTLIMRAGFDYNERQFVTMDTKLEDGLRVLTERVNRVEYAVYQIQKEIVLFDEELRGIHKIIDHFDGRLTRLEHYVGLTGQEPLFTIG